MSTTSPLTAVPAPTPAAGRETGATNAGELPAAAQSLSRGDLGTALLHAMHPDDPAHTQALNQLARAAMPLVDGPSAGIFFGAPALTFVLHTAGWAGPTMDHLDQVVATHTTARLSPAHQRIDTRQTAHFGEYDLMHGLAGIGALLLTRSTDPDTTRALLTYLVRLTEPFGAPGAESHPGWQVWHHHSDLERPWPHANAGLAHGITGPLAVLSLAVHRGVRVPGDVAAIGRILDWLDTQRRPGDGWARWSGDHQPGPLAPSWCYGTPGIARAQQLAAIATGDQQRKNQTETLLADCLTRCLTDPAPTSDLVGDGICHGPAGALRTVQRVAADADDPSMFSQHIEHWTTRVRAAGEPRRAGLLEGAPGLRLVLDHPPHPQTPAWDACLGLA